MRYSFESQCKGEAGINPNIETFVVYPSTTLHLPEANTQYLSIKVYVRRSLNDRWTVRALLSGQCENGNRTKRNEAKNGTELKR